MDPVPDLGTFEGVHVVLWELEHVILKIRVDFEALVAQDSEQLSIPFGLLEEGFIA